jgi:hypothetical protein
MGASCGRATRLARAAAIASAAFALLPGDAWGRQRWRALILAHPLVAHAGEEKDLCAAVIGSRTAGRLRRLEADDIAHGSTQSRESIVPIVLISRSEG